MYMDEYEGQGLKWTLRKGDKIIDSSEPTSPTTATPEAATASSDVVDKLAQAMLKVRAIKSVSAPGGTAQSESDKLAAAMLEARTRAGEAKGRD
jgi:hypothetical protein